MKVKTTLFILLFLPAICRPGASYAQTGHSGHEFRIVVEEGIETALTTGGPKFRGELFEYEEVLVITNENLKRRARFDAPMVFTRDDDGFLYVVDVNNRRIAVFDSGGEYVRSFGEEGEKPGQFESIYLQNLVDGILTIYDPINDRRTRFSTDGTLVDTLGVPRYRFPFTPADELRKNRDAYWIQQEEREEYQRMQITVPLGGYTLSDSTLVVIESSSWPRVDAVAGAVVYSVERDTLAQIWTDPVRNGTWAVIRLNMGRRPGTEQRPDSGQRPGAGQRPSMISSRYSPPPTKEPVFLPFAPLPTVLYRPDKGILFSTGEDPLLRWYDLEGHESMRIRIETPTVPVTDADREEFEGGYQDWTEELAREAREGMDSREARRMAPARVNRERFADMVDVQSRSRAESVKRYLLLPDTKAYWDVVGIDDAGYYWLRIPEKYPWGPGMESYLYWIVSPEGEFLGTTRAPAVYSTYGMQEFMTPVSVTDGYFMAVVRDSGSDDFRLILYRMKPAVSGLVYP